jgi:uncharacterized protein YbcI
VSPREVQTTNRHGDVLTEISDGIVALMKEYYGRGPTRTKTYYEDDVVVCLMRGGFSRVEQTLLDGGRGSAVIQQRMEFQELMRERFSNVIEHATGRHVNRLHERQPAGSRHHERALHPRADRPRRRPRDPRGPSAAARLTPRGRALGLTFRVTLMVEGIAS